MAKPDSAIDPRFDAALIKAVGNRVEELSPADKTKLFEAMRRQKIAELRAAVRRFGVDDLDEEDADFILARLLEPTEEHYQELVARFPLLRSYFAQLFKLRGSK